MTRLIRVLGILVIGTTLALMSVLLFELWYSPVPFTAAAEPVDLAQLHGWGDWAGVAETQARQTRWAVALLAFGFILTAGLWGGSQKLRPTRPSSLAFAYVLGGIGGLLWLSGLVAAVGATSQPATANPGNQNYIPNGQALFTTASCSLCHGPGTLFSGTPGYFAALLKPTAGGGGWFGHGATAAPVDTDGDGFTNGEELQDPSGSWVFAANTAYGDTTYTSSPNSAASLPPAPQVTNISGISNGQALSGSFPVQASLRYAGLAKVEFVFKNTNGVEVFKHTANSTATTDYSNKFCLGNGPASTVSTGACPAWDSSVLPDGTYSLTVTAFDRRIAGGPQTGSLMRTNLTVNSTINSINPNVFTDDSDNGNDNCTLREAIIAANTNNTIDECPAGQPGHDTIQLQAGTYQLSEPGADENETLTGDLDITEDLTIIGAGEVTIIDGGGLDRVFDVRDDSQVTFSNLKIQKGGGGVFGGGGILNGGVLTLTQVIVFNNSGGQGGGIYNATGGAPDRLALLNSRVISNTGELGGGIHNTNGAALIITDSVISDNLALNEGGGIYHISGGEVTVHNSTISNNRANGSGGGLEIGGTGAVNVTNSAITANATKNNGGGLNTGAFATALNLTNSTISGNKADDSGGGLFNNAGVTTLNNVTIFNNTADFDNLGQEDGGGIARLNGTVNLKNTIVAGNIDTSDAADQPDCSGTVISQGYNLIQNINGCTIDATNNIFNQDPLLESLTGSPAYHSLPQNSPAVDAGNPAAPGSGGNACAAADQRGAIRPADGNSDSNAICDIGAFEFGAQLPPPPPDDDDGDDDNNDNDTFLYLPFVIK